jgi:hypothetical protein
MYDYPHTVGVGHDWAVLKVTSPGEEWDPKGPPAAVSCDLPPIGSMVATYGYALGKPAMPFLGLVVSGDRLSVCHDHRPWYLRGWRI